MIKLALTDQELKPFLAYEDAAAMDLRSASTVVILPGQAEKIYTGVSIEIPTGHVGLVAPRSSCKTFRLANTIGLIDADYRGEIFANIVNTSGEPIQIFRGDRILQLCIVKLEKPRFIVVPKDQLSASERGENGEGSSGVV